MADAWGSRLIDMLDYDALTATETFRLALSD